MEGCSILMLTILNTWFKPQRSKETITVIGTMVCFFYIVAKTWTKHLVLQTSLDRDCCFYIIYVYIYIHIRFGW